MENTPSFTAEEQRFVLAEVVKKSDLDPGTLAKFLSSHGVQPVTQDQCMYMQIPKGRRPLDCMLVTQQLLRPPQSKRKASQDHTNGSAKRPASQAGHHYGIANQGPVRILPRPSNGVNTPPRPSPPAQSPSLPKKRGRPSRADKAKRDLKPQLPQALAPRPVMPAPGNADQRQILPAMQPRDPRAHVARHSLSGASPLSPRGYQSLEMARPRVLSDGVVDRPENAYLCLKGSELAPLEPQVRTIGPPSPHKSPTTLPPLLQQGSPASPRSGRSGHTGSMLNSV